MRRYYRQRAPEYDDWWRGTGLFAARDRPGWHEDVDALCAALEALPPARTLDVACGTGFLTKHLPGPVTGLDQSEEMLAIAAERVHAAHFYGHLVEGQRQEWLLVAAALAPELVIVDSALRDRDEAWDERTLNDGSRHRVYKRWFTAEGLAAELGGGEVLHAGPWFVAVQRR